MRVALIVGHNIEAQGAVRVTDKVSEFVWCGGLAYTIRDLAPTFVRVFRREPARDYVTEIREAYSKVNEWQPDVTCELHFNSHAGAATGTETFYASAAGKRFAERVQAAMVTALRLPDRGVKHLARDGRGGASLYAARAPSILIEPYFGSSTQDCVRADVNYQELARGILNGLGVAPSAPDTALDYRLTLLEERVAELERNRR